MFWNMYTLPEQKYPRLTAISTIWKSSRRVSAPTVYVFCFRKITPGVPMCGSQKVFWRSGRRCYMYENFLLSSAFCCPGNRKLPQTHAAPRGFQIAPGAILKLMKLFLRCFRISVPGIRNYSAGWFNAAHTLSRSSGTTSSLNHGFFFSQILFSGLGWTIGK